jgi:transcriptional regulator with GAF, ATPase, and Fis domain
MARKLPQTGRKASVPFFESPEIQALGIARSTDLNLEKAYHALARDFIERAFEQCNGKKTEVAKTLGLTPPGLRYLMKRLDLKP